MVLGVLLLCFLLEAVFGIFMVDFWIEDEGMRLNEGD